VIVSGRIFVSATVSATAATSDLTMMTTPRQAGHTT